MTVNTWAGQMAGLLCVAWRTALTWLSGVRQWIAQHLYWLHELTARNQRSVAIYAWQTLLTPCMKVTHSTYLKRHMGNTQEAHFRPRCYTESCIHVVHGFWLAPVNRAWAGHCLVFGGDEWQCMLHPTNTEHTETTDTMETYPCRLALLPDSNTPSFNLWFHTAYDNES